MSQTHFNPATTHLLPGINLIDASAGTGKTYAIAMLVLRFVVEQNVRVEQLLVVTFTKAATDELKDRIRKRLADAKLALTGKTAGLDAGLLSWLDNLTLAPEETKQRIELALLDIDQAGIFTIHGFCQRILNEHALESGQLFDSELTGDVNAIKRACTDDFWRQQVYPRAPHEAAILTARYPTPDALLDSLRGIGAHTRVEPAQLDLNALLVSFQPLCLVAQHELMPLADALKLRFAEGMFKASYTDSFETNLQVLDAWLTGKTLQIPPAEVFSLLTSNTLSTALNGIKFPKEQNPNG